MKSGAQRCDARRRRSGAFGSAGVIARDAVLRARRAATLSNQMLLARVVLVRDDERDVDAAREQHLQAAHADVVIGEDDGARLHRPCSSRVHGADVLHGVCAACVDGAPSRCSRIVCTR